jgi:hypothetical protein
MNPLGPVLLIGVLLTAVGCGVAAEAQGVPPVPAVEHPKDVRGMSPCDLLTSEQAEQLDLSEAAGITAPEGAGCQWRGDGGALLTVVLFVDGGGLATLAANSEPTTSRVRISGYPALETFTGRGEFCQYDVAIATDQVILASLTGGTPDSCNALQRVVTAILAEVPSLSG